MADELTNQSDAALVVSIVDDDESLRRSIVNLLSSVGITTNVFGSAEEFIVARRQTNFACLVLDVRLPQMSGIELLAVLPRTLPVIMLTAHDDLNVRTKAMRLGVFAFLTKPFGASELVETIKNALGSS